MTNMSIRNFEHLRKSNRDKTIEMCSNPGFIKYGAIHSGYDISDITKYAYDHKVPSGITYIPEIPALHEFDTIPKIQERIFGGLTVQAGWCRGYNLCVNALEYHKTSEVILAVTDILLSTGRSSDISEGCYDIHRIEYFFVPAGTVIELAPHTLHFAPIQTESNEFIAIIILPKDTNLPLGGGDENSNERSLFLFAKNKWLLAYPGSPQSEAGAVEALLGEKICICV